MWACVYGKDGKVFATYQRTDLKGRFVPLAMRDDFHEFGGDHLDLFHKVSLAGETIGTVYVASDLRELEERFVRYGVIVSIVLVEWPIPFEPLARPVRAVPAGSARPRVTANRINRHP